MPGELIDSDIRVARTLPSNFYTGEEEFNALKSVFSGWQFAAHKSELESITIKPLDHIESITGESMVLTKTDEVRCMSMYVLIAACVWQFLSVIRKLCNALITAELST